HALDEAFAATFVHAADAFDFDRVDANSDDHARALVAAVVPSRLTMVRMLRSGAKTNARATTPSVITWTHSAHSRCESRCDGLAVPPGWLCAKPTSDSPELRSSCSQRRNVSASTSKAASSMAPLGN